MYQVSYVVRFWTMNGRLATNAVGRLVDILKIVYAPSCEDMFLSTLVSLMLQLCEQANEFNENIFPNPLSECSFQVGETKRILFCYL